MPKNVNFEVICGSYEEYLIGYIFSAEAKTLTQSFASHDHSSSIRSLATCGHYLASGASDDRIIIYDMKSRKEHCMLTHHEATITALAFTNNHSHVISASQDGALAIVRCGNWQVEKLWEKAHKGAPILDIAVHPSGKLAFTLASDYTLQTWNLVKGRSAYILNLGNKFKDPKNLEKVLFAPDDTRFLLIGGKFTEIWSIEIGGVLKVIEHKEKVTCSTWLDNDNIFVGYENGNIATIEINDDVKKEKKGHESRVKAAKYFEGFISTASSSGEIKIWTRKLKEVAKTSTGCRITCLTVAPLLCDIKKEEEEENGSEVVAKTPKKQKSRVVVEVSDDDNEQDKKQEEELTKKRNKKKKRDSESLEVGDQQQQVVQKVKKKKKESENFDDDIVKIDQQKCKKKSNKNKSKLILNEDSKKGKTKKKHINKNKVSI